MSSGKRENHDESEYHLLEACIGIYICMHRDTLVTSYWPFETCGGGRGILTGICLLVRATTPCSKAMPVCVSLRECCTPPANMKVLHVGD